MTQRLLHSSKVVRFFGLGRQTRMANATEVNLRSSALPFQIALVFCASGDTVLAKSLVQLLPASAELTCGDTSDKAILALQHSTRFDGS
jgi:hypothetical protein